MTTTSGSTSPDQLVLADLNFAEMCRVITRNAGGRVLEMDGVLFWAGAHPSPALVNGAIRTRGAQPSADELLDLAADWFGHIGHGYTIHVRSGRDADLEAVALERGMHPVLDLPVMVYRGTPPVLEMPAGYSLAQVRDPAEVSEYVSAVAEPFEMPEEMASVFTRPESILSPLTAAVIARDADGIPSAGAWTHVSHGVAGIGFVGTMERARGRGLGAAVTWAAIRCGFDMGATMSALQASPMGRSVYARMGFVEVGAYRLFAPAGTAAGH